MPFVQKIMSNSTPISHYHSEQTSLARSTSEHAKLVQGTEWDLIITLTGTNARAFEMAVTPYPVAARFKNLCNVYRGSSFYIILYEI